MFRKTSQNPLRCSFCNKTQKEVSRLIAGPKVYICDECVGGCNQILAEHRLFTVEEDPSAVTRLQSRSE